MKYGLVYTFAFLFLIGIVSASNPLVPCTERSDICTLDYNPVCGSDGKTYGNSCGACAVTEVEYWQQGGCGGNNSEPVSNCKNLYWINNENKSCGQKEFCGAFMYYGLQTFASKTLCEKAVNENCTQLDDRTCCESDVCTTGDWVCPAGTKFVSKGCDEKCSIKAGCEFVNKTFNLSNGRKAEIKIMPETASATAISRLGYLNFTIVLKEVGANQTAYEVTGEKRGKMLGLFKVRANVSMQVDAETGEVLKTKKPWWSFLASGI